MLPSCQPKVRADEPGANGLETQLLGVENVLSNTKVIVVPEKLIVIVLKCNQVLLLSLVHYFLVHCT